MMLAIPNEKIMREVKESLTTAAVGKQRRLSNFRTQKPHTTCCQHSIAVVRTKASRQRVEGENPWVGGVPIVTILA